jgi:hypothetical protein
MERHSYPWFDQLCVIEDNETCIIIFYHYFHYYYFVNIFTMSMDFIKENENSSTQSEC